MPIHCPLSLEPRSNLDFETIDRAVMGASFDSHNHLGRLCDERVYENDVAVRLRASGVEQVETQVPVTLTHHTFLKIYRLDLVVGGLIYELKSTAGFAPEHEAQAIHYAALGDTNRAKLINFGSPKVVGRLLRTPFPQLDRRKITVVRDRWRPMSDQCETLVERMMALLADWGGFLEAGLYQEALLHFLSGGSASERRLVVSRDGIKLGTHRQPCHAQELGYVVTGLSRETVAYEQHLRRLLNCLPLQGIQWLNLNHAELQTITLIKDI